MLLNKTNDSASVFGEMTLMICKITRISRSNAWACLRYFIF